MTYTWSPEGGVGERLYSSLEPLNGEDAAGGYGTAKLVHAIAEMFQEADTLGGDADEGPGWTSILDTARIEAKGLPWLGQLVGVTSDDLRPLSTADQRALILDRPKFKRGTPLAIVTALQATLTGAKTVLMRERYPSEWKLSIRTISAQTPDEALSLAAILSQKPAGITLDYDAVTGQDYQDLKDSYADYTAVLGAYDVYDDVLTDLP